MMFALIRENPAIRTLSRWLLISVVTATFLINLLTFFLWRKQEAVDPSLFVAAIWFGVALYLVFGEVGTRCTPFDMSLPIPTRKLWVSHVVAVLMAGVAIMATTTALGVGGLWFLRRLSGRWLLSADGMGGLAALSLAGLTLAVVLLLNVSRRFYKIDRDRSYLRASILTVVVIAAATLFLSRVGAWTVIVPAVLALGIAVASYRSLPVAFDLVTPGAAAGAATVAAPGEWIGAGDGKSGNFAWFLDRVVYRNFTTGCKRKLTPWITFPFLLFFGFWMSGIDDRWVSSTLRYLFIPMAAYMLLAFTTQPLVNLRIFDPFPISRRRLFSVLMIPAITMMALGYWGGRAADSIVAARQGEPRERIRFILAEKDDNYYTYVPRSALEIAWRGDAPKITSPWGETHDAWTSPLFAGAKLYSPYHTPPGSSIDFVALQISRATEAVYGQAVPPEEIKRRYLEERTNGGAALKGERLTIQKDYPQLKPRGGGPVFPVLFGLTIILWLALLSLYLGVLRPGASKRARTAAMWGVLGVAMALWIGEFALSLNNALDPWALTSTYEILIAHAGETLWGTLSVWGIGAALVAATFLGVASRFARVEAPIEGDG